MPRNRSESESPKPKPDSTGKNFHCPKCGSQDEYAISYSEETAVSYSVAIVNGEAVLDNSSAEVLWDCTSGGTFYCNECDLNFHHPDFKWEE